MNRGKWVIAVIFGLAVAMAFFAWNFQRLRGQRVLTYYGDQVAYLMRMAPQADLWEFESHLENAQIERLAVSLTRRDLPTNARHLSLSSKPGWTHARQALIEDRSYDWHRPPAAVAHWTHLLQFRQGRQHAFLLLDLQQGLVREIHRDASLVLNPKIAAGFRQYLREISSQEGEPRANLQSTMHQQVERRIR
jgi:hypothetical protein